MSRNGSGQYSLPAAYLAVTGETITATQHNTPLEDIASALTGSVPRNGSAAMTAALPMGSNKITGLENATASTDAAAYGQVLALARTVDPSIANGNFDHWQRGTSHSTNGYGSADLWALGANGSTVALSRQTFTNGQSDVPGNPTFYGRATVTTSAGANNYATLLHKIEDVRNYSGQTVTVTFWAKADASKSIATELRQDFGSGGSPSSDVTAIGVTKSALTTSWGKVSYTVDVPALTGKTIGTDENSTLELWFWFDAGSTFNANTDSLGQQSGTFDIARVSITAGDKTDLTDPTPLVPTYVTLDRCKRYYRTGQVSMEGPGNSSQAIRCMSYFDVEMYTYGSTNPTITPSFQYSNCSSGGVDLQTSQGFRIGATVTSTANASFTATYSASVDL